MLESAIWLKSFLVPLFSFPILLHFLPIYLSLFRRHAFGVYGGHFCSCSKISRKDGTTFFWYFLHVSFIFCSSCGLALQQTCMATRCYRLSPPGLLPLLAEEQINYLQNKFMSPSFLHRCYCRSTSKRLVRSHFS